MCLIIAEKEREVDNYCHHNLETLLPNVFLFEVSICFCTRDQWNSQCIYITLEKLKKRLTPNIITDSRACEHLSPIGFETELRLCNRVNWLLFKFFFCTVFLPLVCMTNQLVHNNSTAHLAWYCNSLLLSRGLKQLH